MRSMGTDLVVVYSPVGGGHKAAALATAEAAIARGLSVEIVDAFEHAPRWAGEAYVGAHLTWQNATPDLYGQLYFASNHRNGAFEPLRLRWDALLFGGLAERVRELAPRAVVATHHLPLVVLGRERRKGRLAAPLIGVVTDYIAHACWAERFVDAFAVPFGNATCELVDHGIDRARIFRTGIPVRAAFERIAPVRASGRALRVLVTSGGFGVGPMTRIVRSFAGVHGIELTVVCGAAAKLAAQVADEAARAGVQARVIGFEKDMPARLAEADIVVGKAGGLTVTESLTAGRAMVIAAAVPGNEKMNEEFVVEGGAGVAASADEVGRMCAELSVERMGARARRLVPTGAAASVVDLAFALARPMRVAA
jgi:processive 1,2-diacylglycerol beta-glucosyltransferase